LLDACDDGLDNTDGSTFPELGDHRLIVVAGAGNGGNFVKLFPVGESLDGMIGVGSSNRFDRLSDFSSFNDPTLSGSRWVDVIAPGEAIVSALPGGRYGLWSGTSMSTPAVTGISALIKSKFFPGPLTSLAVNEIASRIRDTGIDIDYTETRGRIRSRRVDARCAVMNTQPCVVAPAIQDSSQVKP